MEDGTAESCKLRRTIGLQLGEREQTKRHMLGLHIRAAPECYTIGPRHTATPCCYIKGLHVRAAPLGYIILLDARSTSSCYRLGVHFKTTLVYTLGLHLIAID